MRFTNYILFACILVALEASPGFTRPVAPSPKPVSPSKPEDKGLELFGSMGAGAFSMPKLFARSDKVAVSKSKLKLSENRAIRREPVLEHFL